MFLPHLYTGHGSQRHLVTSQCRKTVGLGLSFGLLHDGLRAICSGAKGERRRLDGVYYHRCRLVPRKCVYVCVENCLLHHPVLWHTAFEQCSHFHKNVCDLYIIHIKKLLFSGQYQSNRSRSHRYSNVCGDCSFSSNICDLQPRSGLGAHRIFLFETQDLP